MALLGEGEYTYEAGGGNWGRLPEGWFYREATSVAVDSKDRVYVAEVSHAEFGSKMNPPRELRSMQKLTRRGG